MPLAAAGTRPDPAVSVPSARSTSPDATATAEPELDPPEIRPGQCALGHTPCGRAGADEPGGELVEVGDADDHRAGVARALAPPARCSRRPFRRRGSPAVVRQPGDVDVALDRERRAGERQARTRRRRGRRLSAGHEPPRRCDRPARSRCRRGRRRRCGGRPRRRRPWRSCSDAVLTSRSLLSSSSNSPASAHRSRSSANAARCAGPNVVDLRGVLGEEPPVVGQA